MHVDRAYANAVAEALLKLGIARAEIMPNGDVVSVATTSGTFSFDVGFESDGHDGYEVVEVTHT